MIKTTIRWLDASASREPALTQRIKRGWQQRSKSSSSHHHGHRNHHHHHHHDQVCARVQGHTALGDLLNALRREGENEESEKQIFVRKEGRRIKYLLKGGTEEYIEQLIPTVVPINKIKLKFFGHSGVGKSTLIESLKVLSF